MNELHLETSPYLLQHANNPIHWKSWNESTLRSAIEHNKLIIISIGYSACHWCHVMEHESFEKDDVAQIMNQHFINIKIDREERPDIDAVYMKAVQVMTGRGGWPLNVITLPDGRPIWGGTYFRKDEWVSALKKLQELYQNTPDVIYDYAEKLHEGLSTISLVPKTSQTFFYNASVLKQWVEKWQKSFDWEYGGMARAPKFMMPNNYEFLLEYGHQTKNKTLLDFVNLTLTKMAYGGLFDTVDGGFSRYSVDLYWHIPHFEKMLYDNGQLVSLYAKAYRLTQNQIFEEVIRKTLTFVEQEWLTDFGGFYAAFDADSLNAEGKSEEGAFYSWKKNELEELLQADFPFFAKLYNIHEIGHWEDDKFVLIQNKEDAQVAAEFEWLPDELLKKKKEWHQLLYNARKKREKPGLDDKCLTSWNAIMSKGFLDAYKAFGEKKYLKIAKQNLEFLLNQLRDETGKIFRNFKNNRRSISGYIEDYAHVIEACILMYECTWEEEWIFTAKELTNFTFDEFFDEGERFFAFNGKKEKALIVPHFETEDNVIPSANSVMAHNLFRLSIYFENPSYRNTAEEMLRQILATVDYPSAFSNWLQLSMRFSEQHYEVAVTGLKSMDYISTIHSKYLPNVVFCGSNKTSKLPFLEHRWQENTTFYLCQNQSCQQPTESFETILNNLIK